MPPSSSQRQLAFNHIRAMELVLNQPYDQFNYQAAASLVGSTVVLAYQVGEHEEPSKSLSPQTVRTVFEASEEARGLVAVEQEDIVQQPSETAFQYSWRANVCAPISILQRDLIEQKLRPDNTSEGQKLVACLKLISVAFSRLLEETAGAPDTQAQQPIFAIAVTDAFQHPRLRQ